MELQPVPGDSRELRLALQRVPTPPPPVPAPEPEPKPAMFQVQIDPPDARLVVSGEGASVAGDGPQRIVTVTKADGKKKITLLATKTG